jgi:hypothetical protein
VQVSKSATPWISNLPDGGEVARHRPLRYVKTSAVAGPESYRYPAITALHGPLAEERKRHGLTQAQLAQAAQLALSLCLLVELFPHPPGHRGRVGTGSERGA